MSKTVLFLMDSERNFGRELLLSRKAKFHMTGKAKYHNFEIRCYVTEMGIYIVCGMRKSLKTHLI